MIPTFLALNEIDGGYMDSGVCNLVIVEGVGCEMFAKMCYDQMNKILAAFKLGDNGRYPVGKSVRLKSVEVFEHAGNSAIYEG